METAEATRVQYDLQTMRVSVNLRGKKVSIPGKYETPEEAKSMADIYIRAYLANKLRT